MSKLTVTSRRWRRVFQFLIVAAPIQSVVLTLYFCYNTQFWLKYYSHAIAHPIVPKTLPLINQVLLVIVNLIPTAFMVMAFYQLTRLFYNYSQHEIFTEENVAIYKKLGRALFLFIVARFVCIACESLLMTLPSGPGHRLIEVSFGTFDATLLIVSGLIMLIAWVMAEGLELVKEQSLTI